MRGRGVPTWIWIASALGAIALAAAYASDRQLFTAQQAVAALAAGLAGWGVWLRWRGRTGFAAAQRDFALAALALAAAGAWLALTRLSLDGVLHEWDALHYYLGAKYYRELGHDGLYECLIVADAEGGLGAAAAAGGLRDLRTNEVVSARSVLAAPERCTERFTPERWASFRHDADWFRPRFEPGRWLLLRTDHGFNAPPTWTIVGSWLTNLAPASNAQIAALVALDPLLLALMFGCIHRAFGWRTCAVAGIFLATNFPAGWDWVGGSILRYDWLAAAVAGVCLLRLDRPAGGGALVAWSAALRVFPALLLAGIGLGLAQRPITARDRRLIGGAALTGAAALALATLSAGPAAWKHFADKIRLHVATPMNNDVGLPALLAYDSARREAVTLDPTRADPYVPWREARRETAAQRRPLRVALSLGFVALAAGAVRRRPAWVAAVVGAAAVPVLVGTTCYYQALLVLLALLREEREEIAAGLLLFGAVSWIPAVAGGLHVDEVMRWISLAVLALAFGATALLAFGPRAPRAATIGSKT